MLADKPCFMSWLMCKSPKYGGEKKGEQARLKNRGWEGVKDDVEGRRGKQLVWLFSMRIKIHHIKADGINHLGRLQGYSMAHRHASPITATVNDMCSPPLEDKCDLIGKKLYNGQRTVTEKNKNRVKETQETNRT